ncbi:hypothetical protein ACHHYP_05170 [Achlya hypogyna]|uniref:Attractin/MKLN-like beta-propeller domain-containing protein n=1 Tax=Achlya hypogyna TaxID=1202772 RepID=A0A1V9YYI3_ACHHY|nr:hypothetical protein ACHHYP_05170 [Achlya hypogyna]
MKPARYEIKWEKAEEKLAAHVGASPAHRHGHAAVALSPTEVLVYGGRSTSANCTDAWLLSLDSGAASDCEDENTQYSPVVQWSLIAAAHQDPRGVHRFHTMHAVGMTVYVFGNRFVADSSQTFLNPDHLEVLKFHFVKDARRLTWAPVRCAGLNTVSARCAHSSIVLDDGRIFIFGGQTADGSSYFNDIVIFDPATETVEHLPHALARPTPRSHAAIALVNGSPVVYGGLGPKSQSQSQQLKNKVTATVFANTYTYSLEPRTWIPLSPPRGEIEQELTYRAKHAMVSTGDDFVVFGGMARKGASSGFLSATTTRGQCTFANVEVSGVVPKPRNSGTFLQLTPLVLLCFGGSVGRSYDESVYVGSISSLTPPSVSALKRKRAISSDEPEVAAKRPATASRLSNDARPCPIVSASPDASGADAECLRDLLPVLEVHHYVNPPVVATNKDLMQKLREMEDAAKLSAVKLETVVQEKMALEIAHGKLEAKYEALQEQEAQGRKEVALARLLGMDDEARAKQENSQSTLSGSQEYRVTQADHDEVVTAHNTLRRKYDRLTKKTNALQAIVNAVRTAVASPLPSSRDGSPETNDDMDES